VLTPSKERNRFPVAFLVGVVIVSVLVAGAVELSKYSEPAGPQPLKPLPMGPAEQAYAARVHFLDPKMSRAANFLNQEVTFIFGTVQNGGSRQIRQIEVTLEFHDVFNQVVLRDKQRLFPPHTPPIPPGERRDFELAYEHIPVQWNQVYPAMRITGLDLK
jgi:hypothetical protein